MEIKKIDDPAEIITILSLEDDQLEKQVLSKIECTKIEWVQWLENSLKRPNFIRIWGVLEKGKIKAYLVAVNCVSPPISRAVMVLYQNFFGLTDEETQNRRFTVEDAKKTHLWKIWKPLEDWAVGVGARYIQIFTHVPHINAALGFVKEKGVSMIKRLGESPDENIS